MENGNIDINKIDEFLLGRITNQKERELLQKHLSEDANSTLFDQQEKVKNALIIDSRKELKKELKLIHKNVIGDQKNTTAWKWILAAGAFVAMLMLYFFSIGSMESTDSEDIFADNYTPYSYSNSLRGEDKNELLETASSLYQKEGYSDAIPYLEKYIEINPNASDSKLILAISFYEVGDYDKANLALDKIIASQDPFFLDQALWYKALFSLKQGEQVEAKNLLMKLADDSDFAKEAQSILKLLSK